MNYRTRGDFVRLIQEKGFKVREANEKKRTGRCSTKEKTSVFKTISAKAMSVAIDLVTTDWIQVCFAKSERSNQAWSSIADFITTY